MFFDEVSTLISSVSIDNSIETYQLPLTTTHVLLHDQVILHCLLMTDILSNSRVETIQLENQISYLNLIIQTNLIILVRCYSTVYFLFWNQSTSENGCEGIFPRKNVFGRGWNFIGHPTNLNWHLFYGLVKISEAYPSVYVGFIIPFFSFLTDFVHLWYLTLVKGISLELLVLCDVQLG